MGKKIFISYKYGDSKVKSLQSSSSTVPSPANSNGSSLAHLFNLTAPPIPASVPVNTLASLFGSYNSGSSGNSQLNLPPVLAHLIGKYNSQTTVRDYVSKLQKLLEDIGDHINKGEKDNESLAGFKDSTIASKLRAKIYDSSITIVLISKGMKESKSESDQWIPWEISYSLTESTRNDRTSRTNAMLAICLPDEDGKYDYYLEDKHCPTCNTTLFKTNELFKILGANMFNRKEKTYTQCANHFGGASFSGTHSYIYSVKWDTFILDVQGYLNISFDINNRIGEYDLDKRVA